MSSAGYPLDSFKGTKEDQCLLARSSNPQLAVKLFQHTMQMSGGKLDKETVEILVKQNIEDRIVSPLYCMKCAVYECYLKSFKL